MTGVEQIAARAPLDLYRGSKALEAYNVERVRSYCEKNLGCRHIEIEKKLCLSYRTVAKAIRIIRGRN